MCLLQLSSLPKLFPQARHLNFSTAGYTDWSVKGSTNSPGSKSIITDTKWNIVSQQMIQIIWALQYLKCSWAHLLFLKKFATVLAFDLLWEKMCFSHMPLAVVLLSKTFQTHLTSKLPHRRIDRFIGKLFHKLTRIWENGKFTIPKIHSWYL